MTIRFATLADLPSLVEGGSRMHALTRFRSQPYNAQTVAQAFFDLITYGQGKYAFLVSASTAGPIAGAFIGVMEQQIFSDEYTLLLALFLVAWLVGCATGPQKVMQSFSCDMWKDGWATQATLLDYSYGDQVPMLREKARGETGLGCSGGVWMPMPIAEFLYVKWRLEATGEVIEERVDLRGRLPQNMRDQEVTFVIDGRQLYVYLVTSTEITQNLPKAPLRAWRSRYKVTYEIYPTNELKK